MILTSTARSLITAPGLGRRAASGIAAKYSQALFGAALAKSPQTLTKVHSELVNVSTAIKKDPEVATFVKNPTLSLQERNKGLQGIYAKVESVGPKKEPLSDITKNLFTVLSENGRLYETEGVIEGFNELVAKHKGEVTVTVTSATALPKDILNRLETTLKQSETGKAAKVLTITNKVNPSVLGGLIVDFGDKTVDLSVQSRVTKLNNVLTQSV
ncbi:OSCP/delta subunit of ATPase [Crepidotus variabilis]|uniref:ATP synthase subunit 5, mitochondrial n=1 Tax=Crepidotus variabilis TaxID=179855 RepID=A0A9P6EH10_9AGAR|nr:OSCP/delta subunit of ATPase [Crepidotus variabilis]